MICESIVIGRKIGHLTVVMPSGRRAGVKPNRGARYWICRCVCGGMIETIVQKHIRKHCGCIDGRRLARREPLTALEIFRMAREGAAA